ncbi:8485_t:CDS:2 [Ambispora gerdemannii]|uniref:8485_t:CDS:1 n=1 Tax=Ambispora gerdemannii TaxID=144530 RepID=A0A9N9ALU8_9GLOM|nr:8485_t:CDS:2 [Ambispora gerdemannii]
MLICPKCDVEQIPPDILLSFPPPPTVTYTTPSPGNNHTIAPKPISASTAQPAPTTATMQNLPNILPSFTSSSSGNNDNNNQPNSSGNNPPASVTQLPQQINYYHSTLDNSSVQTITTVVPLSKVVVIPTTSSPSNNSANSFLLIDASFDFLFWFKQISINLLQIDAKYTVRDIQYTAEVQKSLAMLICCGLVWRDEVCSKNLPMRYGVYLYYARRRMSA